MKFLKRNIKTLVTHLLLIGVFYWLVFQLTPKVESSIFDTSKLDRLDSKIDDLKNDNIAIEQSIDSLNLKIERIDEDIMNIKMKKEIIKEYYYEKIKNVDSLSVPELDSFFTERYGKWD